MGCRPIASVARRLARSFLAVATLCAAAGTRALASDEWTRAEAALCDELAADAPAPLAPDPDRGALDRYVVVRRGTAASSGRQRAALQAAKAALKAGDPVAAESIARGGIRLGSDGITVTDVELIVVRGEALRQVSPPDPAVEPAALVLVEAADRAASLGWRNRSASAFLTASTWASEGGLHSIQESSADRAFLLYASLDRPILAATALAHVAAAASAQRSWHHALRTYDRAIALFEQHQAFAELSEALTNRARVYLATGFYAKAISSAERALDAARRALERDGFGPDDHAPEEAEALDLLGVVRGEVGDLDEAERLHSLAYEIHAALAEASVDPSPERRTAALAAARALGHRAIVRGKTDDLDGAETDLRAAMAIFKTHDDRLAHAKGMSNLAEVFARQGRIDDALAYQAGANKTLETLGAEAEAAMGEGFVADHLARAGRHREAIDVRRKARAQAERIEALDVVLAQDLGSATSWLALARAKDPDPAAVKEAVAAALRARRTLGQLVTSLGDEEAATARGHRKAIFEVGVEAALLADDLEAFAEFVEGGRAATLLEVLGSHRALAFAVLPADLAFSEQRVREALAEARSQLQAAVQRGAQYAETSPITRAIATAEGALTRLRDRIRREAKSAARLAYPEPAPLEDLRRVPREGEALVAYAVGPDSVAALVIHDGRARLVRLGAARDLAGLALTLQEEALPEEVEQARARLLAPLGLPATVRRLLVSPDGDLHLVPFGLLAADREVALVPSGTALRDLRADEAERADPVPAVQRPVLALGGVDYAVPRPSRAGDVTERAGRLLDLPRTSEEAAAVGTVVLRGGDATVERLLHELARPPEPPRKPTPRPEPGTPRRAARARWGAIHLACHGLFHADRSPLLACLALTPTAEHDGDLTVSDVLGTAIEADLVVLSACRLGSGRVYVGDGMLGMAQAFLSAGAPRVVCCLWNVNDDAGAHFARAFHAARKGGASTAGALRAAQQSVAAQPQWKAPYYWAGWHLWGLPE